MSVMSQGHWGGRRLQRCNWHGVLVVQLHTDAVGNMSCWGDVRSWQHGWRGIRHGWIRLDHEGNVRATLCCASVTFAMPAAWLWRLLAWIGLIGFSNLTVGPWNLAHNLLHTMAACPPRLLSYMISARPRKVWHRSKHVAFSMFCFMKAIWFQMLLPRKNDLVSKVLCMWLCQKACSSFHFHLYCTVWGVEPDVTHQTSWPESTGECGMRQNQADVSSDRRRA